MVDIEDFVIETTEPCPFRQGVDSCAQCDLHGECRESVKARRTFDGEQQQRDDDSAAAVGVPRIQDSDYDRLLAMVAPADGSYTQGEHSGVRVAFKKKATGLWEGAAMTTLRNTTPAQFLSIYWPFEERRKWDTFFGTMRVVETLGDGSEVIYMSSWAPPLIAKRDFVQVRQLRTMADGTVVGLFLPAVHPLAPPVKGFVRGVVVLSGFTLKKVGNDTEFTLITNTDPGLPVPEWLVTKLVGVGARIYSKYIREALRAKFGSN